MKRNDLPKSFYHANTVTLSEVVDVLMDNDEVHMGDGPEDLEDIFNKVYGPEGITLTYQGDSLFIVIDGMVFVKL